MSMKDGREVATQAHSIVAEQCVIASIIFDNSNYNDVSLQIKSSDFYDPFHRRLYELVESIIRDGSLVDFNIIDSKIDLEDESLKDFDTKGYLEYISKNCIKSKDVCIKYSEEIRENSVLRNIATVSKKFFDLSTSKETGISTKDIVRSYLQSVSDIASKGAVKDTFYDIDQSIEHLFEDNKGRIIKTGLREIDEYYPIMTGKHHILAGNTSQGKSMLAICIALFASQNGYKVHIYSTEMDRAQIVARMIGCLMYMAGAPVDYERIYRADLRRFIDDEDWFIIRKVCEDLERNIIINDNSEQTVSDIIAGSLSRDEKPDLVVVDYLHDLSFEDIRSSSGKRVLGSYEELGQACRRLKGNSKDHDIATLTLAQNNREPLRRSKYGRPTKHDIEGAGKIEQGADWIAQVYRKAHYISELGDQASEEDLRELELLSSKMEVINCKNRMGRTGSTFLDISLESNYVG